MTVTNVTPPALSGTFKQGQTVSTDNGSWSSDLGAGSYFTYAYRWLRCDAAGANCVAIPNATSQFYPIVLADVGSTLRSEVTATDHVGPSPPTGSILFQATSESGNWATEWTSAANGSDCAGSHGCVTTPTAEGGVIPREGSRMLKLYISTANRASWSPNTLQSTVVQKDGIPSTSNGDDDYYGFSIYVSSGFQYASSQAHVTFAEWHGTSQMEQAPIHFGVFGNGGNAGQMFLDLHRQASGYSPVFQQTLGYSLAAFSGQWMNVVIRTKWSSATDGAIQCWIKPSGTGPMTNADLKCNRTGIATWNTAGAAIKLVACIYRGIQSNAAWTYMDAIRVGTTLEIVDPGSYS